MPIEAMYDKPFSWGNVFLPRGLYRAKMQRQGTEAQASAETQEQWRKWLKLGSDMLKAGTVTEQKLNEMFESEFGIPGPFTTPKIGGEKGIETRMKPEGYEIEEVTKGGTELPKEIKELVEAYPKVTGQELPVEALLQKWTGYKKEVEKPSALQEKKTMLEETLRKPSTDPSRIPMLKMLGALIDTSPDRPVEVGYGDDKMIKMYYDPSKQEWKPLGKPYKVKKETTLEKYTLAQLEDDARTYADSLHGSMLTAIREEDRIKWVNTYTKYIRDNSWKLTDPMKRAEMLKKLGDPLGYRE